MARFDKMLKKVRSSKMTDKEATKVLSGLDDVRTALEEGISHYYNKEMLNDYSQPWYGNAKDHYESRLEQVNDAIKFLKEKYASVST